MEQESPKIEVDEMGCETLNNDPILCANNCGFFGSAATNNLCSKCYKDYLLKQSKASSDAMVVEKKVDGDNKVVEHKSPVLDMQKAKIGSLEEGTTSENPGKRTANRCGFCGKRVGLTGFKCRCGQTFCSLHRYSDKHNCLFDYKSAGQNAIAKANPVVKANKIEKI